MSMSTIFLNQIIFFVISVRLIQSTYTCG
uniref:Uncharacterized protein n=1 Tax=Anguilla anguilla TaxID=7936 RepID=A0A0E9VIC9_ANGAN